MSRDTERLRPLAAISEEPLRRLGTDLDSNKFPTRETAIKGECFTLPAFEAFPETNESLRDYRGVRVPDLSDGRHKHTDLHLEQ